MRVAVQKLTHRFGGTTVLRDISLEVADRELFFLLGPSGCGKTTLLRLIAGFYRPDAGEIRFGDRLMNGVEPHRRNTGMVFQNYALWPHLTVAENVAYGLDVRGLPDTEKRERTAEALRIVRMEDYATRSPNQLSGGQQQRVALARALVIRPDVLLLDEPLSNLDARLRLEMRDEIRRIHNETRITTIYVTHDQKEALSMADRLAVLREGILEQLGAPREVYRQPANRFVADFIGEANWLTGEVSYPTDGDRLVNVSSEVGPLRIRLPEGRPAPAPGPVRIGIRPESVRFTDHSAASRLENVLAATVSLVTYLGEIEQTELTFAGNVRIKAFEADPAFPRKTGDAARVQLPPDRLFLFPA